MPIRTEGSMLIPLDQAVEIVLGLATEGQSELISTDQCLWRSLAEPFSAKTDLPPFTTSSVDGFAVKLPCLSELDVVGEVPAGRSVATRIGENSNAVEAFTGSLLPEDTDAVVMVEDVERIGSRVRLRQFPEVGDNLRRKGEELRAGTLLLSRGNLVNPPVRALLANSGQSECSVFKRPRVAVIETGNELRSPGDSLSPGEIYAANGVALSAAAEGLGAVAQCYRCEDDPRMLRILLERVAAESDFVITSGGVSVGKHDHVRSVWNELGAQEQFWRVAIRPGRPLFFATMPGGPLIFGLPGNPVSSLVTFHLTIRPALLKFWARPAEEWLPATTSFCVDSSESVEIFERVQLKEGIAHPIVQQGSHMSSGLAAANALLRVPRGTGRVPAGALLNALPLLWR